MKICPAFRIQSVKWTYHIGLSIQQETNKQGQNERYEKGTGLTLAVGWEDREFFPEGFSLKLLLAGDTFNSLLLDGISKHLLFFLGFYWIQINSCKSVQPLEYKVYTELIKLASLFNKTQRNKDKITAMWKGKASLWLLAGNTLNSFLKYWFSNCYWLGRHSSLSYWVEFKKNIYINWMG